MIKIKDNDGEEIAFSKIEGALIGFAYEQRKKTNLNIILKIIIILELSFLIGMTGFGFSKCEKTHVNAAPSQAQNSFRKAED